LLEIEEKRLENLKKEKETNKTATRETKRPLNNMYIEASAFDYKRLFQETQSRVPSESS
jgi:hypothetical protein